MEDTSYPDQHTPWKRGISYDVDETGMLVPFLDYDAMLILDEIEEEGWDDDVSFQLAESVCFRVNNWLHWNLIKSID